MSQLSLQWQLIRRCAGALLLLMLAGCSSFRTAQPPPVEMLLLQPAQGPQPVLLTQRITLNGWGQQQQLVAIGRFTYAQTQLVALLPTGQQLLYLAFDGEQLEQRSLPSIELPGKDILAQIQFALWPDSALLESYRSGDSWAVVMTGGRRQLFHDGTVLLDVSYRGQQINIENHLAGYRVSIETLEQKDLLP